MKRRACAFCKSAKKKCDGGSPCSSCAHSDLPCFYPSQLSQPTQPRPQKPRQKQKQKQPQQQQQQQQPLHQPQQHPQQQPKPQQHPQYQQLQQKLREHYLQRAREASKVKETTFHFKKLRRTHKGIEEEEGKVSFSLAPDKTGVIEEGGLDSYKDQIGVRIGDPVFFRFPPLPPPTLKRKKKNGKTVEWCTESEEEIFWEYLGERKAVPVAEQPAEVMSPSLFVDRKNACDAERLMATVQEMNHPAYLFQSPWKRRGSFIERHGYKTEILNNPVGENFLHDPTNPSSTIFRRSHNITQVMFLRLIHQFSFSWDEVTKEVYSPYYVFFGNQLRCLFARFQFFYDRTGVSRYLIINFPYNFPSPSPSFSPFYFPLARFSRTGFPFSPPKQAPVVLLQTDEENEIDKSATQLQLVDPSLLQTATPPPLFRVFSQIQELQEQLLQPHQQQYQQLFPQPTIPPQTTHFQVVEIPETQPFVSQQQQQQRQQLQILQQDPSPPLSSGPKTPQVLPPQQTIIEIEHQQPNPLSPTLLETQPPEQLHHQQQEQQQQLPSSPVFSSHPAPFSPSPFENEFSKDTISEKDSIHSMAPSHLFPSSSSPFPSASSPSPPSFLSFFSSSPSLAPSPSSSPYLTSSPPSLPSFSSSPSLPPPSPSSSPSPPPSFPPPSPSQSPSSPSPFSPSSPSPFFSSLSPSSSSPSSPTPFSPSPSLSSPSPPSPFDSSPSSPSPSYSSPSEPSPFSPTPSSPLLSLLSPSEPFPLSSPFLLSNDEFINF